MPVTDSFDHDKNTAKDIAVIPYDMHTDTND
jgi:hypothetical protein